MGTFRAFNLNCRITPPLSKDTRIDIQQTSIPLLRDGFNIEVIVSTATILCSSSTPHILNSAQIIAHFDTGASKSSIDVELAKQLGFLPIGESPGHTAAGLRQATEYVIDLSFPATNLKPFINLRISSCQLTDPAIQLPFKMLLGRDVMSRWNILWDGPSSTIIIND